MPATDLALHIHDDIPVWLDTVNRRVDIVQLLEYYSIADTISEKREEVWVGPCPLHSGNQNSEFYVYSSWNTWACYGACHRGGTVLDFVSIKEQVSLPIAALLLQTWFSLDLAKLQLVDPARI